MGRQVVIVDDHEDLLEAVADLLGGAGWGPITTAASAADGFVAVERTRPECRRGRSGGQQRGGDAPAAPPAGHARPAEASWCSPRPAPSSRPWPASAPGPVAFVPKTASPQDLVDALTAVESRGRLGAEPAPRRRALDRSLEPPTPTEWEQLVDGLTRREHEVLELMVAGFDRPSIARQLEISLNTVRTHTKNILAKLGVHSSLEAVSVALRAGVRPADGNG